MKLVLAPILIFLILGLFYFFYFYPNNTFNSPSKTENSIVSSENSEILSEPENVFDKLLESRPEKEIPEWLKKYQNSPKDKQFIVMKRLLDDRTSESEISDIADSLEIFPEVYTLNSYKNALTLIDNGYGEIVFKNIDKFNIYEKSQQEEIIRKIREEDQLYLLAQNFNFFNFSSEREYFYANELMEKYPNDLYENFEKFKQIQKSDHFKYANGAIDKDKENLKYNIYFDNTCVLMKNLYKFNGLTENQKISLFNRAYDNKFECAYEVLQNFEKWNIENLEARLDIAAKIIMMGNSGMLIENIQKFNFNSEQQLLIAQRIIDAKQELDVLEREAYYFNEDVAEEILRRLKK
jgi:hypothetical protein